MTPLDTIETALHAAGRNVKRRGDIITAQCPAHDDGTASLSIGVGTTRDIVIHCHAGCKTDDILDAIGIKWSDFGTTTQPDAVYPYHNANGDIIYEVVRKPGKKFMQRRPDGAGGWEWNLNGVDRTLYRLPKVLATAAAGGTIYVCEGEKDVERLETEGVTATCNSGGAGKFEHRFGAHLRGANVIIVADRDEPGVAHAHDVAKACHAHGINHTIVQAAKGKDAADHFTFGGTLDTFIPLEADGNEATAEVWPDPVPLRGQRECPPFPIDILPKWVADQCRQVAEEMQYGPDLPGQLALVALSVPLVKRVNVSVNGGPWVEDVNIWTVTGMNASAGKSPAFSYIMKPLYAFESCEADKMSGAIEDRYLERRMIEREREEAIRKGETARAMMANSELREKPAIHAPRLVADDTTAEALTMLLQRHEGRMCIASAEGGIFQAMAGRYSDMSNLDIYLGGWNGENVRQDRVGRDAIIIQNVRLAVGLAVQPHVIAKLADNPEFHGRGLVQRFMYSMPVSTVGKRDKRRKSTWNTDVDRRYRHGIRKMIDDHRDAAGVRLLTFAPDATDVFQDWQQGHEERMGPAGDLEHIAEWVSKMHSTVARVAAVLHVADDNPSDVISVDTVRRALRLGDYWEAHSKIASDLWGADEETTKALKLLTWMIRQQAEDVSRFAIRDIQRGLRSTYNRAEEVVRSLNILTESGWVRSDDGQPAESRGKRNDPQMFTVRGDAAEMLTQGGSQSRQSRQSLRDPIQKTHSLSTDADGREGAGTDATDATESPMPTESANGIPPQSVTDPDTTDPDDDDTFNPF